MGGAGVATGAGTRSDVILKLPQLQNLCKRDPEGYREDYDAQIRRLQSECGIIALSPSSDPSPRLVELIQFAAAVSSSSYKGEESNRIVNILIELLMGPSSTSIDSSRTVSTANISTTPAQLHRDVRKACVSALILMRNKGVVEPIFLLEKFFNLMSVVPDKALRELLHRHIVNDIRNINKKGKRDDKVNRSIQSFFHKVISTLGETEAGDEETATDVAVKRATEICCELYRRNVWTDERTVAILASAVTSKNATVMCRAIRFFLNVEEKMAQDQKVANEVDWDDVNRIDYHSYSKKTASRTRHVRRQLKNRKMLQKKREADDVDLESPNNDKGVEASKKLYPAIELLHDPQGLAEAVFKRLRGQVSYKYEAKLLMINFVTRLIGNHQLLLLPIYPFLQRYMGGHQRDVTAVLAYCVQACHEYVPPDEVYGILKTIAHNFITERCSEEQMAVGINAVRAICARVPSVLSKDESKENTSATVMDIEAFARDLAAYSNHRDRSVSIAGKAWLNFVRELHPSLLQGKARGLAGSALYKAGEKPLRYGQQRVATGVEGADLLVEYESKKKAHDLKCQNEEDEEEEDENEVDESGEWVDVEDDENEEDVEGVEDESADGWIDVEGDDEAVDEEEDSDDESAPDLVLLQEGHEEKEVDDECDTDKDEDEAAEEDDDDKVLDLSKMTPEERGQLRQEVSSNRVFTTADFVKMRKLVERERRAKRDPREAARRKRAVAQGKDFQELSDDNDDDDDMEDEDKGIKISGAVNPEDINAEAKRKRQTKADKLEKIIAGREKFESKARSGGSTNIEKKRKKNFLMSKFSRETRLKANPKYNVKSNAKKRQGTPLKHDAKKRRRKA